jgi:release factor glutamine methyltransferase
VTRTAADTLGSILAEAVATLAEAGCEAPRRRARQLIAAALGMAPGDLLIRGDNGLAAPEAEWLRGLVARLGRGEPASRILGRREFWGLDFALSPDTLDPRPDSETVVEAVLARRPDRQAALELLDLGTGTGCLLCALLSEYPAATGIGVDVSAGAAATARRNARALGLADRGQFVVGYWADALGARFDVIVTNPPYIPTGELTALPSAVGRYDPRRALDGGADGLTAYRLIAAGITALLVRGGLLAAEIGEGQAAAVCAIFREGGLFIEAIERDLAGIERCVVAGATAEGERMPSPEGQKNLGMCRRRV